MTGLGPAELKSGGRAYFDALVERVRERNESGYEVVELLAGILEISFAHYRATVAMGGGKPPPQLSVERPGTKRKRRQLVNWRVLRDRVSGSDG